MAGAQSKKRVKDRNIQTRSNSAARGYEGEMTGSECGEKKLLRWGKVKPGGTL